MDENCITFVKIPENERFFYDYDLQAAMTEIYAMINDIREKNMDCLYQQTYYNFFQKFLSCIREFRIRHKPNRKSLLVVLPLYRLAILLLVAMPLTQTYDGISKMLRRIYLIHHQRTTSVTDDSAVCGIA